MKEYAYCFPFVGPEREAQKGESSRVVVKSILPPRPPAPPPEELPVQHSPAYLLRHRLPQVQAELSNTCLYAIMADRGWLNLSGDL
jgi:hypothetical protein